LKNPLAQRLDLRALGIDRFGQLALAI
jgi:hypothetical protein